MREAVQTMPTREALERVEAAKRRLVGAQDELRKFVEAEREYTPREIERHMNLAEELRKANDEYLAAVVAASRS